MWCGGHKSAGGISGVLLALTACASAPGSKRDAGAAGEGGRAGEMTSVAGAGGNAFAAGGGNAFAGAAGTPTAVAGNGGLAGSAGAATATCPLTTPIDAGAAALHLPIELVAGDTPLALGQEFSTASGGAYLPGVVSFFLSQAVLTTTTGARVPAHFTDATGAPRPYDVLLVNASDPTSLVLDLSAPAGTYTALELGVGLSPGCNHGDPTQAAFPLNASTGLYWTWATGYMFIRIEGELVSGGSYHAFSYHIGSDSLYRTIVFTQTLTLPSTGEAKRLVVDLNHVMAASDAAPGDLSVATDVEVADRFAAPGTLALHP